MIIFKESVVAVPAPARVTILAADPKLIGPDHVLFPLGFKIAPWVLETPSPLMVIGSGILIELPVNFTVAPLITVVVANIFPSALFCIRFT